MTAPRRRTTRPAGTAGPAASPGDGGPQFGGARDGVPAPRKRTGLLVGIVVGIVVAAVHLAGGAVTAFLLLGGESDEKKVTVPAARMVAAIDNRDETLISEISCTRESSGGSDRIPDGVEARHGEVTVTGDNATIPLIVNWLGQSMETTFEAGKRDGEWCVGDPVE